MKSYASTKAKWIIWCTETDTGFTAYGSRNIRQLDIEADYSWDNYDLTNYFGSASVSGGIPTLRKYKLTGDLVGFTMVTAKTELEALVSLLHTLQQEEACEKAEAETTAKRVKEEKKREKAHKKAVRQAAEGKFDAAKCVQPCFYCSRDLDEAEAEAEWDEDAYKWYDEAEEY